MLETALVRGLPFAWVAADADYGKAPSPRAFLHANALPYVLGVPVTLPAGRPAWRAAPARRREGRRSPALRDRA
ncbi:hypothetical protein GCM10009753_77010 [Streptantibioticus ferralitis]